MKGKSNIWISSIACWGISLAGEGSFEITPKFPCKNQLSTLQIKGEILIYSGGPGISVGWASQPCSAALQNILLLWLRKSKIMNSHSHGENPVWGWWGHLLLGRGTPTRTSMWDSQPFPFTKMSFFPLDFRWASYFWFMALVRAEGWSVRCCAALLPVLVFQ